MKTKFIYSACICLCILVGACTDPAKPNYDAVAKSENCIKDAQDELIIFEEARNALSAPAPDDKAAMIYALKRTRLLLGNRLMAIERCRGELDPRSAMEFDNRGYFGHYRRVKEAMILIEAALDNTDGNHNVVRSLYEMTQGMMQTFHDEDSDFWNSLAEERRGKETGKLIR